MHILGIDPGMRNLGWVLYDIDSERFIDGGRTDLTCFCTTRADTTKYSKLVKRFLETQQETFRSVTAVVIEKQMKAKFKIIETSFQCFFWEKAMVVSPLKLRNYYGLSRKNYRANKKASVQHVEALLKKRNNGFETFAPSLHSTMQRDPDSQEHCNKKSTLCNTTIKTTKISHPTEKKKNNNTNKKTSLPPLVKATSTKKEPKVDDVADAVLLVLYFIDHHHHHTAKLNDSNQN